MNNGKGRAVGEREPKVRVLIGLAERTPAWEKLMQRLLTSPPCKDERLPLEYASHLTQEDGGDDHA